MRGVLRALIALYMLLPLGANAADEKLTIDLNSVESSEHHCRMNFVVENTGDAGLESLKLDLVVFGNDGGYLAPAYHRDGTDPAEENNRARLPDRHRVQGHQLDPGQ